jgi:hypothetical protein
VRLVVASLGLDPAPLLGSWQGSADAEQCVGGDRFGGEVVVNQVDAGLLLVEAVQLPEPERHAACGHDQRGCDQAKPARAQQEPVHIVDGNAAPPAGT